MQKIRTPQGETLVVLPLAEYEELIATAEDRMDIAMARQVEADLAAGREEQVPAAVVDRLLAGEAPLRVWRQHRGLSARALAQAAGISPGYLSEIENGRKEGSLSVMKRLADALNLELDDLI